MRRLLASVLGLALCGPVAAQSTKILGRDNVAFARELYSRGYVDLAQGVYQAVVGLDENKAGYQLVELEALALDLRLEEARDEEDLAKRKDLISAVIAEKEKFISTNPRTAEAKQARESLPDAYALLGEALAGILQAETDPEKVAKLRTEGEGIFKSYEESLNERIQRLSQEIDQGLADEAADTQLLLAKYNQARTYYFHSLLYGPDDLFKEMTLEKAIEAFDLFGLDYSDTLTNYEGMIYKGLAHKDLGKPDDALLDFDDAIALREVYAPDSEGRYPMTPYEADLVASAVLQKMLLLKSLGRSAEASEEAAKYLATTPDPLSSPRGLAVLSTRAEALIEAGDSKAAAEAANSLVNEDSGGPWGARGREILGRIITGTGGGLAIGGKDLLKIAQSMLDSGNHDRAIAVCHQALAAAKGQPDEADVASEAFVDMGMAYWRRGWLDEAASAFDASQERYAQGAMAPEGLWQAINVYLELNKLDKRPFYKTRIDDRMRQLPQRYPTHRNAAYAQLVEGRQLESDREFLKAAELYQRVPSNSPVYEEALFRAGNCFYQHAKTLHAADKTAEAKTYFQRAEDLLRQAHTALGTAMQKTLDVNAQGRLAAVDFSAIETLAKIYLTPGLGREKDVLPLIEGLDETYASDTERTAKVWSYRIQALEATGKLDEAIELMEALVLKNPGSRSVASASGVLARALDARANQAYDADPRSTKALDLWRKAARYYAISVAPGLKGEEVLRADLADDVALRLLVIGRLLNGVPESTQSFVGWSRESRASTEQWEEAATLFEHALAERPSYRTMIRVGQTYAFLGRWRDAAAVYARLFDQEKLYDRQAKRFSPGMLGAKPELLPAFLEWGVAEHETALLEKDKQRFTRAFEIFDAIGQNTENGSQIWWGAKYFLIKSLLDRGEYEPAQIGLNNLERTTNDFDEGKYGYKDKFLAMKAELGGTVRSAGNPGPRNETKSEGKTEGKPR